MLATQTPVPTTTSPIVAVLVLLLAVGGPIAAMLNAQLRGIVRNTFFESIRQPIVLVIVIVAKLLTVLSLSLASHTLEDDQRMYIDIGLATVFLAGALLAAFLATSVLTREIHNKTVLTVVSKPVSRPLFVIGKFLGVGAAILVCMTMLSLVFMIVEVHGVQETVRSPYHAPVLVFGNAALIITVIAAVWCNYFYGKVFSSTYIVLGTPLLALAYFGSLMFSHDFTLAESIADQFKPYLWLAIIPLMVAVLVLTAIAIAASTRLGQVMTLCTTLGFFLFGMLSDWMFGQRLNQLNETWIERAETLQSEINENRSEENQVVLVEEEPYPQRVELITTGESKEEIKTRQKRLAPLSDVSDLGERVEYGAYWTGYAFVPNFQVLWLSDAVTQYHVIPAGYIWRVSLYGTLYCLAALSAATILFQRREVG